MNNIKEAANQWSYYDSYIRNACEELRETIHDIDQDLDYMLDGMYPETREELVSFEVHQNALMTHWEYIDGYESICDSETTWSMHFGWFDMSREELVEVFKEQAEYRRNKERERQVGRLKMEAEHLGLQVLEKGD